MQRNQRLLPGPDGHDTEQPTPRSTGRVLIVDDEPNVRLMFRTALESAGFQVDEADSGPSALQRLRKVVADVMLLDLQMPGTCGMDVLRQLREAGNNVSVVIITAHGSVPDAVAAMRLGAIDFLAKPLTPEALRRVVVDVISRQSEHEEEHEHDKNVDVDVEVRKPVSMLASAKRALGHRLFHRAGILLHEAIKENPGTAEPHYLLGVMYEVEGKPRAASQAYRDALRVDPDYEPAKLNLMKFHAEK